MFTPDQKKTGQEGVTKVVHVDPKDILEPVDKVVGGMKPELRKLYDWLLSWGQKVGGEAIRKTHELGKKVKALYEDSDGKKFGKNAQDQMSEALGKDFTLSMKKAYHFADTYSQDEVDQFCETKIKGGRPLSLSHLFALMRLPNAAERKTYLDRTIDQGLTSVELNHDISKVRRRDSDGRGRPISAPKDVVASTKQLEIFADKFLKKEEKFWEDPEHSLPALADSISLGQLNKKTVEEMETTAGKLEKVALGTKKRAEELFAVAKRYRDLLENGPEESEGQKT
jgi:hypothetical protein